ncbi:hypothetical protein F7725_023786 [Dissostichus mawsoni]|uniref:Uncharacterized protein n=1 Tax=Dissostichus mawsoni TaxID=36200 RepID=A0A7J5XXJ8_DISMA|nr:hypothetical protein F7725_023786 [Dissostichus mawsoni]
MVVRTFAVRGPPSSPPISGRRRYISVPTAIKAKIVKSVTEKASWPGSTLNSSPLLLCCDRTNDGGQQADHTDGDHEASPAVPVVCGRDEGEQNLPEHASIKETEEEGEVRKEGRRLSKLSTCKGKRRSTGEKLLRPVEEEMSRWKEKADRRRCDFDGSKLYSRGRGKEEEVEGATVTLWEIPIGGDRIGAEERSRRRENKWNF